jgi:hypothetical protein
MNGNFRRSKISMAETRWPEVSEANAKTLHFWASYCSCAFDSVGLFKAK